MNGWEFSVERADNMYRRGRMAEWHVGPLFFYANTADEGTVAFEVRILRWSWGWSLDGPTRPSVKESAPS